MRVNQFGKLIWLKSEKLRYHIFSEEPADPYWKQVRYALRAKLTQMFGIMATDKINKTLKFVLPRFFQMWGVLDGLSLGSFNSDLRRFPSENMTLRCALQNCST